MARILWHGIGPWHRTAYGLLTAEFPYRIRDLGHEVVIAVMGRPEKYGEAKGKDEVEAAQALGVTWAHPDSRETRRTGLWDGMRVIGPGTREFGLPEQAKIREAFGGHDPDLIIVLKDPFVLYPDEYRNQECPVLVWANIDCDPIGQQDLKFFRESGTIPVAVSKFGLSTMRKKGLKNARYVPHGIDTDFWTPGDRDRARELMNLPKDVFIAGICAANVDQAGRKGWQEQFSAFATEVKRGRRDSLLIVHASPKHHEGINLRELAYFHGLNESPEQPMPGDHVRFGSNYNMKSNQLRTWYRALNVLMACSLGEGFGMPIVEALSCGIPVIGTDCSAISEKIQPGCGWLVKGQRFWHWHFQSEWTTPNIAQIAAKLGLEAGPVKLIRESAAQYDAALITATMWKPLIEEMTSASA